VLTNKIKNRQTVIGFLFAFITTAIWAGNFVVARSVNESISPVSLSFWRWLVAIIAILPFALKQLIAERDIIKKNLPYLSVTSLLGITMFSTLVYLASHSTAAVNLSLISITFPIFIVIFSRIFYHEEITLFKGIGIILVAIGVVLLISKGNPSRLLKISFSLGDIWMLIAAISFAIYSILLKHKPKQLNFWAFQSSLFILGIIFLFPFFVMEYTKTQPVEFDIKMILSILYVGILVSLVGFALWNKAVEKIGPYRTGMTYYTSPLFSGFWAYIFLKEEINMLHFYSALLILSGIIISNYMPRKGTTVKTNIRQSKNLISSTNKQPD